MASPFTFPPGREFNPTVSDKEYDAMIAGLKKYPSIDVIKAVAEKGLTGMGLDPRFAWMVPFIAKAMKLQAGDTGVISIGSFLLDAFRQVNAKRK